MDKLTHYILQLQRRDNAFNFKNVTITSINDYLIKEIVTFDFLDIFLGAE